MVSPTQPSNTEPDSLGFHELFSYPASENNLSSYENHVYTDCSDFTSGDHFLSSMMSSDDYGDIDLSDSNLFTISYDTTENLLDDLLSSNPPLVSSDNGSLDLDVSGGLNSVEPQHDASFNLEITGGGVDLDKVSSVEPHPDNHKGVPMKEFDGVPLEDHDYFAFLYQLHKLLVSTKGVTVDAGFRFDEDKVFRDLVDLFNIKNKRSGWMDAWMNRSYDAFTKMVKKLGFSKVSHEPIWMHEYFTAENPDLKKILATKDRHRKSITPPKPNKRRRRRRRSSPIVPLDDFWIPRVITSLLVPGTIKNWARPIGISGAIIDVSSPTLGEKMQISHLTSVVVGDSISRLLQFSNIKVQIRSIVRDHMTTQDGVDKAWIAREEVTLIYQRLGVSVEEYGVSSYCHHMSDILNYWESKGGLIKDEKGAFLISLEGHTLPFTLVDTDGNCSSVADLEALRSRAQEEIAQWLVYVTDDNLCDYYKNIFSIARHEGWLPACEDSSAETTHIVKLGCPVDINPSDDMVNLLCQAKCGSKALVAERGNDLMLTRDEIDEIAEVIGYGAVKYDLVKNSKKTGYAFNLDDALDVKGNTAVALQYAYARIRGIINGCSLNVEDLTKEIVKISVEKERQLAYHLVEFSKAVQNACLNLEPLIICDYVNALVQHFNDFFSVCHVCNSTEEKSSRLVFAHATSVVIRTCLELLGIVPVDKI